MPLCYTMTTIYKKTFSPFVIIRNKKEGSFRGFYTADKNIQGEKK